MPANNEHNHIRIGNIRLRLSPYRYADQTKCSGNIFGTIWWVLGIFEPKEGARSIQRQKPVLKRHIFNFISCRFENFLYFVAELGCLRIGHEGIK